MRRIFVLFVVAFSCSATPKPVAPVGATSFPEAWLGTWKGTVSAFGGGEGAGPKDRFSMELTIAKTSDPLRYEWKTIYDGAAGRSERPYQLIVRDAAKGRYAIDEGGLVLEASLIDGVLLTWFDIGGSRLLVREEVVDAGMSSEVLHFEIVSSMDGSAVKSSEANGATSYPPSSFQRAVLFRQANAVRSDAVAPPRAPDVEPGVFPSSWINGLPAEQDEPPMQIHAYNEDLYILRQSVRTNFEAPFITLIFGESKVLMLDTGAGNVAIYDTVKGVIDAWLAKKGRARIDLVAAHLHAHGDHVQGDSQFKGKPDATVVGKGVAEVKEFFGIADWPNQIASYDLGGRVVDIVPIPGHEASHIAVYDRRTALLFTGDSLYPGRLYINGATRNGQFEVFKASIQRLVDFTADKPVAFVIGTHIEMTTTPQEDYPMQAKSHPNEHPLQLTREHLLELNAALSAMGDKPVIEKHADFIIYPIK